MDDPAFWHRLQFAFTICYHYLFPQLTMGLAPFLVLWKWQAWRHKDACYATAVRFWAVIFGINFAVGVVTGIPMEFQFGTNWAGFSRYAGGIIGQTLAMEGMIAFFLESAFVGLLVWGEKRLSPRAHFLSIVAVAVGSWLSGYFILVTNAFMQHPVGYAVGSDGGLVLADLSAYLLNPWALVLYLHNMTAALVTGAFAVASVGAFYALRGVHLEQARLYLHWGTAVGLLAALAVAYPTGDLQAKMVAAHQPAALAAMEGRFQSGPMAQITIIGQPNVAERRIDNAIEVRGALSFVATGSFHGEVRGLDAFPQSQWPTNIELLYYAFHIMVGLGTLFIALMTIANLQRWRGRLLTCRPLLWALLLALPFPYIATTAGWITTELGRQPWLVYGLFRTSQGISTVVSPGNALFSLMGFTGLYFLLGVLYLFVIGRKLLIGPRASSDHPDVSPASTPDHEVPHV